VVFTGVLCEADGVAVFKVICETDGVVVFKEYIRSTCSTASIIAASIIAASIIANARLEVFNNIFFCFGFRTTVSRSLTLCNISLAVGLCSGSTFSICCTSTSKCLCQIQRLFSFGTTSFIVVPMAYTSILSPYFRTPRSFPKAFSSGHK